MTSNDDREQSYIPGDILRKRICPKQTVTKMPGDFTQRSVSKTVVL